MLDLFLSNFHFLRPQWLWALMPTLAFYVVLSRRLDPTRVELLELVGVLEDAIEVAGHRAGLFFIEREPRQKCGSFDILAADP